MAESKLANMIFSSKVMEHKDFTKDIKHDEASKNAKNSIYGLYRIMASQYAMNQLDEDQRKSGDKSKPTDGQYMKLIGGGYTTLIQRSRKAKRHYAELKDELSEKHETNTPKFNRVSTGLKNSEFLYYYGHKGKTDFLSVAHRDHAKGIPLSANPFGNKENSKNKADNKNPVDKKSKSQKKINDKTKLNDTKIPHLNKYQKAKYVFMYKHGLMDYDKNKFKTPEKFAKHVKYSAKNYNIPKHTAKSKSSNGKVVPMSVSDYKDAVPKKLTPDMKAKVGQILAKNGIDLDGSSKNNQDEHVGSSGASSGSSLDSNSKSLSDLNSNPYDNKTKSHSASSERANGKDSSEPGYSPQEKAAKYGPFKHPFMNRGWNAWRSHRVHKIIKRKKFFANRKANHHQHRQEINHMKSRAWAQRMGSEIPGQYSGHSKLHRHIVQRANEAQRYAQESHNKFHRAVHENTAELYKGIDSSPRTRIVNNVLSPRNAAKAGFNVSKDAAGLWVRTALEQHHGHKYRKYGRRAQKLENLNSNTIKKPGKGAFNQLLKKAKAKSKAAAKAKKSSDPTASASSKADATYRAARNQSLGTAPQQNDLGQAPGASSSDSSFGSEAAGPSL